MSARSDWLRLQTADRKLTVAKDDRQQIVEVMRNTSGEQAHGLHLLRLSQLIFGASKAGARLALLSRFQRNDAEPVRHWDDAQIEPSRRTVGKQELDLGDLSGPVLHAPAQHREDGLQLEPRIALHQRAPDQPFPGTPRMADARIVHVQVLPLEADDLTPLLQAIQHVPRNLVERLHNPFNFQHARGRRPPQASRVTQNCSTPAADREIPDIADR